MFHSGVLAWLASSSALYESVVQIAFRWARIETGDTIMRALVTGGIGFIGTNLADRLLRDGHDVVLFDNISRAGVQQNLDWLKEQHRDRLRFIEGDVRDTTAVEKASKG